MKDESVARSLLSIGAVYLRPNEPFTWASGIKSPVYCDNRLILGYPQVRETIERKLAEAIRGRWPECDVLMGTATAGIAHAAIAAHLLGLPAGYVRGAAKDHGRGGRIEGRLEAGWKAVVVEDLVSTAGSCVETARALREAGAEVLGAASIFTYGMARGLERLKAESLDHLSLTDLDTLVEVAVAENYIRPDDRARLLRFRDDPSDESWMR